MPGSYGSTPNPFRWNAAAGCQHIPFTGLYHVGAREYDPRTARWLQRDPIGQSSGDPNLYRYCGNDAVNLCDPSGLFPPLGFYDWLTTPTKIGSLGLRERELGIWEALKRYNLRDGKSVFMSIEGVNLGGLGAAHIPALRGIIERKAKENRTWIIFDNFIYSIPYWKRDAYVFGNIALSVRGILHTWADGSYSFDGVVGPWVNDRYDFNPSSHRSLLAECSTSLGRLVGGTPYDIFFVGERSLSLRYEPATYRPYIDPLTRQP